MAEKRDVWSLNQQLAAKKLIEDIDKVLATHTTSYSIARNVGRLVTDYKREHPE